VFITLKGSKIVSGFSQAENIHFFFYLDDDMFWQLDNHFESNQKDSNIQVSLLFLVSSTCFGLCFRQSSGALDCISASGSFNSSMTPAGSDLCEYY
jgi:hypothetical protein